MYSYHREHTSPRFGRTSGNMYSSPYGGQSLTGSPAPLLSSRGNYSFTAGIWANLNQSVREPYYDASPSQNRYKRPTPLLQSRPLFQRSYYNSPGDCYEEDYDSYHQLASLLGERPNLSNYGPTQQSFTMPWMERNQVGFHADLQWTIVVLELICIS